MARPCGAQRWLGLPEREPAAERRDRRPPFPGTSSSDCARRLWNCGGPIEGTLAERYLADRSTTEFGPALRYHPTCFYRTRHGAEPTKQPALRCTITDLRGTVVGLNRIYLGVTGGRADVPDHEKVLDRLHGCAVGFGVSGDVLIVGEGSRPCCQTRPPCRTCRSIARSRHSTSSCTCRPNRCGASGSHEMPAVPARTPRTNSNGA